MFHFLEVNVWWFLLSVALFYVCTWWVSLHIVVNMDRKEIYPFSYILIILLHLGTTVSSICLLIGFVLNLVRYFVK